MFTCWALVVHLWCTFGHLTTCCSLLCICCALLFTSCTLFEHLLCGNILNEAPIRIHLIVHGTSLRGGWSAAEDSGFSQSWQIGARETLEICVFEGAKRAERSEIKMFRGEAPIHLYVLVGEMPIFLLCPREAVETSRHVY